MVICQMLGVPAADWDQFKPWSTAIVRVLDPDADPAALEQATSSVNDAGSSWSKSSSASPSGKSKVASP